MFPDFLVIGAQKAGTTWLHRNLQAHPQVWMPKEKELHYFDEKIAADGWALLQALGRARPADERWRRQVGSRLRRYSKDLPAGPRLGPQVLPREPGTMAGTPRSSTGGRARSRARRRPDYSILGEEHDSPRTRDHARGEDHLHDAQPRRAAMVRRLTWGAGSRASPRRCIGRGILRASSRATRVAADDGLPENAGELGRLLSGGADLRRASSRTSTSSPTSLLLQLYEFLGVDPSADYRIIRRKIHSATSEHDADPVRRPPGRGLPRGDQALSERFGGYASFWLHCAQRLIEDPPDRGAGALPVLGVAAVGGMGKETG